MSPSEYPTVGEALRTPVIKEVVTYWVKIYISGPQSVIEQTCREDFLNEGLCVTIEPTKYLYKGGEETGCVIGLLHYPRFPKNKTDIWDRAVGLARKLLWATFQESVLIVSPEQTWWISIREKDMKEKYG